MIRVYKFKKDKAYMPIFSCENNQLFGKLERLADSSWFKNYDIEMTLIL
jgi:hypothetical protein